jgi:hypothetical protein
MKTIVRISLAALALGLVTDVASAQLAGLPVNYAPAGAGVSIGGTFGIGLNNNSGKPKSVGGMLTYGADMFWIGAGASYFDFLKHNGVDGVKAVSFGGNAGYKLPLGPDLPVDLAVVAGAGYTSKNSVNTLMVPAGVTLGIKVPSTGVAIVPWASPQFRYTRVSVSGVSGSKSSWGVSGGLAINMPMGIGFDVVGDYDGNSKGFLGGLGLHYTFASSGGGM